MPRIARWCSSEDAASGVAMLRAGFARDVAAHRLGVDALGCAEQSAVLRSLMPEGLVAKPGRRAHAFRPGSLSAKCRWSVRGRGLCLYMCCCPLGGNSRWEIFRASITGCPDSGHGTKSNRMLLPRAKLPASLPCSAATSSATAAQAPLLLGPPATATSRATGREGDPML